MKGFVIRLFHSAAIVALGLAVDLSVAQAQEPSVPGVYLLIEVNGARLPAVTGEKSSEGEHCETEVLNGAVLLDSDGRSAAFVTEREVCARDDGSEGTTRQESVIFPGSYVTSGDRITINDAFGTDQAVLEGDLLTYTSGGGTVEYVLRKQ